MPTIIPPSLEDTHIPINVILSNGESRRFAVALRDLGPDVLPNKLRHLLAIPITQDILLERFSTTARAYITLDGNNPSVYKQLYRAASTKLSLHIKLTVIKTPTPQAPTDHPELSPNVRLSSNCYVSPTNPESAKTEATRPVSMPANRNSRVAFFDVPTTSNLPGQVRIDSTSQLLKGGVQPEIPSKVHQCPAPVNSAVPPLVKSAVMNDPKNCHTKTEPEDKAFPPQFFYGEQLYAELAGHGFTICCNKCDAAIPNAHWHCSRCDNGDYDLCNECVSKGVLCESKDHWLIKRFVQNGKVITSTTERIEPKKISAIKEAMVNTNLEIPEDDESESRTCNSCIEAITNQHFFTCTDCADYDLCLRCLMDEKHGHHPSHAFTPASENDKLSVRITNLCKPGRNIIHGAICDACDKEIRGVRHKCIDCPDWDYCSACVQYSSRTHPGHRFVPFWEAVPPITQRLERHYGIHCDGPLCTGKGAHAFIVGDRYKCAVCHDTDFCANCEALPTQHHNRTHPLIKFKSPIRNVSVTTLGEKENGEDMVTMGDQLLPTKPKFRETPPATKLANAATQVRVDEDTESVKEEPKVEVEPKVELEPKVEVEPKVELEPTAELQRDEPEIKPERIEDFADKVKDEGNEVSGSQMIFPKLDKESPVASTHEAESGCGWGTESGPVSAPADYQELSEDLENLELASEDENDDDFLSDEEYDLLDMSDAETCVAPNGRK